VTRLIKEMSRIIARFPEVTTTMLPRIEHSLFLPLSFGKSTLFSLHLPTLLLIDELVKFQIKIPREVLHKIFSHLEEKSQKVQLAQFQILTKSGEEMKRGAGLSWMVAGLSSEWRMIQELCFNELKERSEAEEEIKKEIIAEILFKMKAKMIGSSQQQQSTPFLQLLCNHFHIKQ
jgi:hypothetical protein